MAAIKRYLITGGNGYIATNIIKTHSGHFSISDYGSNLPAAHRLPHSIVNSFDGVIHLAALSGIFACEENPYQAVVDNVMSAANVFNLATEIGIPVVFTSSQAAKDPHSSVYANMKWTCETLANYFNTQGGDIRIVRLANVYGAFDYLEKKQTCVKQFITKYREGEPFEVHGNGNQARDFVHVWDVCIGIMKVLESEKKPNEPIDIGTGIGTTILDLAKMFPRNRNHHYEFVDGRNAGADSSVADTTALEELTGFKPERKLEDYIKEMI